MSTSVAAPTRGGRGRSGGRPKAQRPVKSTPGRRAAAPRICDFCRDDPAGKVMHAQRECDWTDGPYPLECTNCADHRALHPVAAAQHECQVPRKALMYRKYSEHHPARYDHALGPVTGLPVGDAGVCCVKCANDGRTAACDVDPILGYQCSRCKAADNCSLPDGRLMNNKPNLRQGVVRWFRHACDGCAQLTSGRRIGGTDPCSWLADHTTWTEPCDRCRANNLVCLASGMVASMPDAISIPENWRPRSFIARGWAELRPSTVWRKACMNCRRDNNHCRASVATPYSACGRCTGMGLDCVDHDGTAYPIFDLSQVGFGSFLPFTACRRCVEKGRNCDRQRACDSCTNAGEAHLCDNAFLITDAGKKRMGNCLHGRLHPQPGPLYYLAHGYGANGVNDVKDGSRMEHWIGPVTEVYVLPSVSFHEGTLIREVSRQREALIPRSTPPHAAPGTPLASKSASQLTADDIAAMIDEAWPESFLMNALDNFAEEQEHATLKKSMYEFETLAGTDSPPTAADIVAAASANPNFVPRPVLRVIQPLPVVAILSEEDMDEDDEESEEQEDSEVSAPPEQVEQGEQPAAASSQSGLVVQHNSFNGLAEGTAANSAGGEDATDIFAPEIAQMPIDPALNPCNPAAGESVLPYVPFRRPSLVSTEDNTMPGHAMTLHADRLSASDMEISDVDSIDHLDPSRMSPFPTAGTAGVTTHWQLAASTSTAVGPTHQQLPVLNPLDATSAQYGIQVTPAQYGEEQSQEFPTEASILGGDAYQHMAARWEHLNPLHDSTRALLGPPDNTGGTLLRKPFTLSISYLLQDCPVIDVLHSLPEPVPSHALTTAGRWALRHTPGLRCEESDDQKSYFYCGAAISPSAKCADTHHQQANYLSHVCDDCAQHSAQLLVDPRHGPLTADEVLGMRSYLCDDCTMTRAGASTEAMLSMCAAGVNTVYGHLNGLPFSSAMAVLLRSPDGRGDINFFPRAWPLTGCACGVKLFQTRQCRFHRFENAKAVLNQVATVREWRMRTNQHGKCAGCFEYPAEVRLQRQRRAAAAGITPLPARLHSWVCLACGGWVMNQPSRALVNGWQSWFNPLPLSLSNISRDADE